MRMIRVYMSSALLSAFLALPLHAQVTYELNGMRIGDKIEKQQIEYVSAGEDGEDAVWDFSGLSPKRQFPIEVAFSADSTEIYEISPERISKYSLSRDSLIYVGYEKPLERIDYQAPIKLLPYPFQYGDSFSSPYTGLGYYCQMHEIETGGNIEVEADGKGSIILSSGDTLKNVLRIHSLRTGFYYMHQEDDTTDIAKSRKKQEIEERYLWYARGYRYPVIETISTAYYDNMNMVSCIQTAYRYNTDDQKHLYDPQNDSILYADSINASQPLSPDIIDYSITTNGRAVNIKYSLTEDASISILLCNHRGMTYRHSHFSMPAGEGYETSIDTSGLQPDTYILYINVNGKVHSEKVTLY